MQARNPYRTTFIERVLLGYQSPPTGHPFNPMEKSASPDLERGFTPDVLQQIEFSRMMQEGEKVEHIQRRDNRWFDGMRGAPKDITRGEQSHEPYKVAITTRR